MAGSLSQLTGSVTGHVVGEVGPEEEIRSLKHDLEMLGLPYDAKGVTVD